MAMFLRGAIGYWVSVDSVSVILKCKSVGDAIFNSLAITFIADLSQPYWEGVSSCFGLEVDNDFKWLINKEAWDHDGTLSCQEKKFVSFSAPISFLAKSCRFLRRGEGFELIEDMTTFIALSFLYLRQLFVVVFALKTKVLPAARDVCTMWRWQEGESQYLVLVAKIFSFLADKMSLVDTRYALDAITDDMEEGTGHPCETKYRRMLRSDHVDLIKEYGGPMGLGIAFIVIVLFGRRLMVCIYLISSRGRCF